MFKAIKGSSLASCALVLAYFHFLRSNTFHVAKATIMTDEEGNVFDYVFPDGSKLNLKELPTHYIEIPEEGAFTALCDDMSNAPLEEDVLIKFADGSIENAFFEKTEEGEVLYCLFDGEMLTHNPVGFAKMPQLP